MSALLMRALIVKAQSILAAHLPPDGPSEKIRCRSCTVCSTVLKAALAIEKPALASDAQPVTLPEAAATFGWINVNPFIKETFCIMNEHRPKERKTINLYAEAQVLTLYRAAPPLPAVAPQSTLGQQVAAMQAEIATWPADRAAGVQFQGAAVAPQEPPKAPHIARIFGEEAASETVRAFGKRMYQQGRTDALPEVPAVAPADEVESNDPFWREKLENLEWSECERISNVPDVHETLSDFSSDPTGDAGICVVRAILAAAKKGTQ